MGGTYGNSTRHSISGDSTMMVRGGNFSGQPYQGSNGFSSGAQNEGTIYGNASLTVDLRGNKNGFKLAENDNICGGRGINSAGNSYLGTDADNTIELTILTDPGSNLLERLNIYGDSGSGAANSGNTRSEKITINVNAPDSEIGNLYATNYVNLTGTGTSRRLWRDVTINLVSATSINGLSCSNGFDTTTLANTLNNDIANRSIAQDRSAVINVGPQSDDPDNILSNWETTVPTNGLPRTINVGGSGINGFTSMNINERLLVASSETGTIKNGGANATLATHGISYHQTGHVTLQAGVGVKASGLGVVSTGASRFVAGNLKVEGSGTAYIESPGAKDQVIFTNVAVDDTVTWLKVGSTNASSFSPALSSWFGEATGWYTFTLNPVGANAEKMTPFNLEGLEPATGKVFIGDNVIPSSGGGYAVCLGASIFKWQVTKGEGMISHNVDAYTGTTKPATGYLKAIGTVAKDTPSKSGKIAVPVNNIPTPVDYPKFSFIPDGLLGEWVQGIRIHRSDEWVATPPHGNCLEFDEQSLADYNVSVAARTKTWTSTEADKQFAFNIAAQYKNNSELSARSIIITEAEAAALIDAQGVVAYNEAAGRPFFAHTITNAVLDAIREPLETEQCDRAHPITYSAGIGTDTRTLTVNIVVVKSSTVLSPDRNYAVYAHDASITLSAAQGLTDQAELDTNYTHAIAIRADGSTTAASKTSGTLAMIKATKAHEVPREIPITYSYAPDSESTPVTRDITVRITPNALDFVFFKVGQDNVVLEGVEFVLYPQNAAGTDWDLNNPFVSTSDSTGKVEFLSLEDGEYLLEETKTHAGYALPSGQWRLGIDSLSETIDIEAIGSPTAFSLMDGIYTLPNYRALSTPRAGGIGNVLFTMSGIVLIGTAVIVSIFTGKEM
jgi:hypothetical protein